MNREPTRPAAAVLAALLVTIAVAACGGANHKAQHFSPAQMARAMTVLQRLEATIAAGPQVVHRVIGLRVRRVHARGIGNPLAHRLRPVPGAAGRLTARYRTALHGGVWLASFGAPGASGRATVRFYGRSEACWQYTGLRGLNKPLWAAIFEGRVAPRVRRERGLFVLLGGAFKPRGCATGLPSSQISEIEIHPQRFYVGITDGYHAPAIGGQL